MAQTDTPLRRWSSAFLTLACSLTSALTFAAVPREPTVALDQKAFYQPELVISTSHVPLEAVLVQLRNRAAWETYLISRGEDPSRPLSPVFVDPRTGTVTNLLGAFPLIPGNGVGNHVTSAGLARTLGRPVAALDASTVAAAVRRFAEDRRSLLGIDTRQLGEARVTQINADLWQVSIPQSFGGVPVRDGRLAASISHGNLVVIGTEIWADVRQSSAPRLSADDALAAGFAYAEGRVAEDIVVRAPRLEFIPIAPQEFQHGERFAGPVGQGLSHRLAWTFVFRRPPDDAIWEVMVDAGSGEVLAFQDVNQYQERRDIKGGVYPLTNTEICPSPQQCGTMQSGWPMPFADTGFASPNSFTNSGGVYTYPGGTATTTLTGRYVDIADTCGAISESSTTGAIDLGGVNGDHDCTVPPGTSPGNTASSRSCFYEVNKIAELARGYLPTNTWLQSRVTSNVNLNQTCNAFYSPAAGTINFYRSGGGCRNTGEIAGVFDHEWGHGLDDNDAAGSLSNSSEGYADIAAIYRLQTSCVGHGFWWTSDRGCGTTADGTGFNANEAQQGAAHCDLDCSGVRDADWDKHADHTPDTALGFVCTSCLSSSGPCGRQVHCAAAPSRQAAWDLVARDLRGAPFNLDSQTAFIIGNKLFYQGSGNIGLWHSCTCGVSSDGCGATNGYMQWLTADDDNGNLSDGTPHMTAIFNAFNRHGIACSSPTPVNSGCGAGPATAPTLAVSPGNFQNALSWNGVAGATRYWVFRTEGHAGCDFGKARIAEVTGTSYTDGVVANGRAYHYNVVAAGAASACFSPASNCATGTPSPTPDFSLSCSPSSLSVPQGSSGSSSCSVASQNGFSSGVTLDCTGLPAGASCTYTPNPVTPPANGSASSALAVDVGAGVAPGTYNFQARGTSGSLVHTFDMTVSVTAVGGDFTLSAAPPSQTVVRGQSTTYTVTVTPSGGFAGTVTFSASGLPRGVSASFNPPSVAGSGSSVMTVTTQRKTPRGTHTLTIVGTSGTLSHTTTVQLVVDQ
jgi:hypothetical protein